MLLYCVTTYLPQFFMHLVNEEALGRFRISPGTQHLAVYIPFFVLLVFFLQNWIPRISMKSIGFRRLIGKVFESRLNILLASTLLVLAINFNITEGISFRQKGDLLSEVGMGVAVLMFCKPYIYAWLVYHFILTIRGVSYSRGWAITQGVLFLATLVLSITSSLEVLPILWITIFIFVKRDTLRRFFLHSGRRSSLLARIFILVFAAPLGALAVGVMVWIGYINKIGIERTTDLVAQTGIAPIIQDTMVRVSSSYASVISFAEHNVTNYSLYERIFLVPVQNIPYRASLIFGDPLPRPEITQINRLNYLNYDVEGLLERAGASPGLVASGFYAAPFPLGFLLMGIYVVVIMRVINSPFATLQVRPRILVVFFCASFVYTVFESPVDYLDFIDPTFLNLMLTLGAFIAASAEDKCFSDYENYSRCGPSLRIARRV